MRRGALWFVVGFMILGTWSCSSGSQNGARGPASSGTGETADQQEEGRVAVATVGGETVWRSELVELLAGEAATHRLLFSPFEAVRQEFLQELIDQRLAVLDTVRKKVDRDPVYLATVEAAIDGWAAQKYIGTVHAPAAEPTEEDLRPYIPPRYERIRIRHILLPSREEAERVRREILAGKDFADAAREHSRFSATAPSGGDLGWVTRWQSQDTMYSREEIEPLYDLPAGTVSEVMETALGVEIFLVEERADLTDAEIDAFLSRPRSLARWEKGQRIFEDLYRERGLVIDEAAVDALLGGDSLPDEAVLGEVGGWKLTAGFYRSYLAGLELWGKPARSDTREAAMRNVRLLLQQKAFRQTMEERGFFSDPDVAEALEAFRRKTLAEYYTAVLREGVEVTDEDVQDYYRRHLSSLAMPARVRLKMIVVAEEARAWKIHRLLGEGKDWDALAGAYSVGARATKGGDMGWVYMNRVAPEFQDAVGRLSPGEYTEPVRSASGSNYTIVRLEAREAPAPLREEDAAEMLRPRVLEEKTNAYFEEYFRGLEEFFPVSIDEEVLRSVTRPPVAPRGPSPHGPGGPPPGH